MGVSNIAGSGFSFTVILGLFLGVVAALSKSLILSEMGVLPMLERRDIMINFLFSNYDDISVYL